jgi:hypothetical protein
MVDALVELHRKSGGRALVLVHIEIQAQKVEVESGRVRTWLLSPAHQATLRP